MKKQIKMKNRKNNEDKSSDSEDITSKISQM